MWRGNVFVLALALILSSIIALSVADSRVQIETTRNPKSIQLWQIGEMVHPNQSLVLTFALKQRNLDQLEKTFLEVSDPNNPRYGKYLTLEEVNELVSPSPLFRKKVVDWLVRSGVAPKSMKIHSDFIRVNVQTQLAEKLIECPFYRFTHKESGKTLIRCNSAYSVPSHVADYIDFIGGVSHFPKIQAKPQASEKREEPGLGVTPRIIRDRYAIGSTLGQASNNKQAVAQFLEQYYSQADLEEFFTLFFWPAIGTGPEVVGPNYWYDAGVEASLDIEYIMSVGGNISTIFYSTPGLHENQEPFLEWALNVSQTPDAQLPKVISISYGDDEDSVTEDYANRCNVEFQKLGVRGVSLLFASGDSGVSCNTAGTQFVPSFPASSPWITAVGGSTTEEFFELGPEIVNSLSGGGFSNYFGMPSYQKDAVKQYFQKAKDLPAPSFYNSTGRAYPDVSALSSGFTVVIDLIPMPGVAGTSAASPTFAGVISLLNDLQLQKNKPTLGFLNPWLYQTSAQHPDAFFDITEGCNPGGCPNDGFCATSGWDPASGVGTPLYAKMALYLP